MTTKVTSNVRQRFSAEYGNESVFHDSIALATNDIDAADIIKLCFIPAGTEVNQVIIKTTDMDTNGSPALAAKIGFTPVDGSAAPSGSDTAVSSAAAFGQSAGESTINLFPAYRVEKDSWIAIVITTGAGTAAAGTVHARARGEILGVK